MGKRKGEKEKEGGRMERGKKGEREKRKQR
jgi:hypothetical protein